MKSISFFQSFRLEFYKAKRKPTLVIILGIIAINLAYLFIGTKKHDIANLAQPWESIFFYLPLMNTLFVSIFMAYLASRCTDIEHKGHTRNLLNTLQSKSSVYVGKIVYGMFWICVFTILEIAITILFAGLLGMPGFPAARMILITSLGTILGGMAVYNLQLIISMIFMNQFAALSVSVCGTLTGLFSMYVTDKIFLPWSVVGGLRSLNMDYDEVNSISTYTVYTPSIRSWLIGIAFALLPAFVGLYLYSKMEEDSLITRHSYMVHSNSIRTYMPAEFIKLRRSPVWIPFIVLPIISALIGVFNFLNNQDVLHFTWSDLWTQQSLFLGLLFMSPLIAILCSLLWRMEHVDSNWNIILTIEPAYKIVKDKLIISSLLSILGILWVGVVYVISGKLLGIPDSLPPEFYQCMICGILACITVSAVQTYLSLIIRSFALPICIAFVSNIVGLAVLSKGYGFFFPYSMLQMGLKSTNLTSELDISKFAIACITYIFIFYSLSIIYFKKADAKTA